MASASSVIKVSIIGDVKNLQKSFGQVNGITGGALGSLAKVTIAGLVAGKAIDGVFDIAQDSLNKADDFNDNLDRLSKLTTPDFANRLKDTAFGFASLGLSAGDVAGLAVAIAAYGKAAGAAAPTIEANLPALLDVAEAIHAKTGKPVNEVIDDIGKAIGGSGKTVKDYGISVDAALNPDDTLLSILGQAKTLFGDANTAASDLHGTQDKINANVDNFKIKLGEALEGPLNDVAKAGLEILDELKDWPGAIGQFGDAIVAVTSKAASPLGNLRDLLGGVGDVLANLDRGIHTVLGGSTGGRSEGEAADTIRRFRERNGLP